MALALANIIREILKTLLFGTVFIACMMLMVNHEPSLRDIGLTISLIGGLVLTNTSILSAFQIAESLKKDLMLVQMQNTILTEVKKNGTQVLDIINSQADLLSNMTDLAMKNQKQETKIEPQG